MATALATPAPMRIASVTASANTPIGASARIQPTTTNIASATPRKNSAPVVRKSEFVRDRPAANNTANTIIGSIAPSAAALIGFAGTRLTSQLANVGNCTDATSVVELPRTAADDAASM